MIEISLLRTLNTRDGYERVYQSVPLNAIEAKTRVLVEDIKRYYETFDTHQEIDYVLFRDMFFTHWHKTLDEETRKYYAKILLHAEKKSDDVSRAVLINSLLELNLANDIAGILERYNDGDELDLVGDITHIVETAKSARESREDHNWIQTPLEELLQEDEDDTGLHWRLPCLEDTTRPLRAGDLVIVAGRPDSGKTTFTAGEITHMATQENERPIVWCNNEGSGTRIYKRVVQSALRATIPEMIEWSKDGSLMKSYEDAIGAPSDRIRVIDIHGYWNWQVEELVDQHKPKLLIMDMIDNVKFSGLNPNVARTDQILEGMYQWAREMSVKKDVPVIATSQLSGDAEGLKFPEKKMLKDSKTGKQGAAELMIMLGRSDDPMLENSRFISTPKNKLRRPAVPMPREEVYFNIDRARYENFNTV